MYNVHCALSNILRYAHLQSSELCGCCFTLYIVYALYMHRMPDVYLYV